MAHGTLPATARANTENLRHRLTCLAELAFARQQVNGIVDKRLMPRRLDAVETREHIAHLRLFQQIRDFIVS